MSEQRDGTGTGTGVWAHPAAEPEPEQRRCECGECYVDAGVWWWKDKVCVANSMVSGYCPGECGCRLSVVDGEPRVGPSVEKLLAAREAVDAVLDELTVRAALHHWHADEWDGSHDQPEAQGQWYGYSAAVDMLREALRCGDVPTSTRADVLNELRSPLKWWRRAPCTERQSDCPFGYKMPCHRYNSDLNDESTRGQGAPCWLGYYGLADTYEQAAALWARMEEAAK